MDGTHREQGGEAMAMYQLLVAHFLFLSKRNAACFVPSLFFSPFLCPYTSRKEEKVDYRILPPTNSRKVVNSIVPLPPSNLLALVAINVFCDLFSVCLLFLLHSPA